MEAIPTPLAIRPIMMEARVKPVLAAALMLAVLAGPAGAQGGRAGAGADPCGPGFRQAPQTDRCDPIPGASGEKARAAGRAGKFPVGGQSLGGIVRSAPSQSAAKIASLAEGAPLTIVARDVKWDGYDWFKVTFDGRTGYQWGGIMCSRHQLDGVLRQCDQP